MCIQTGKLCNNCQEKYDKGEITDLDIEIGKELMNLTKSVKYLSNITLLKIILTSDLVYLIVGKGDKEKLERARDQLLPKLHKIDKRTFIILEKTKNAKRLIEELLTPIMPVGSSIVLLPPDGLKELKIQIKKQDKDEIKISANELSKLTEILLGMSAHYAYV